MAERERQNTAIASFVEFLSTRTFGLSEGSMFERMRRHPGVKMDPLIVNSALIYDERSAALLERTHREYLDVGQREGLPMIALTDTWRANPERVRLSQWRRCAVNRDNATFMTRVRSTYPAFGPAIYLGGTIGPRGDAYQPQEALSAADAERFHRQQVEALAEGGVDFLYAATLPALSEAQGIARATAKLGMPSVLSFVVRADGALLDGTPLSQAITAIDDDAPPAGYAVNCVYPTVFVNALEAVGQQEPALLKRIVSFQANTSSKDPSELDGMEELETEEPHKLAALMLGAHQRFGVPLLGGCCGTGTSHIASLGTAYRKARVLGDQ